MKKYPSIPCPYCGGKHFTKDQAIACADDEVQRALAKERRLTLINRTLKKVS